MKPLIGQETDVKDPFGTKFNVESYLNTHEEKLPLNHFKSGNQDLHKEIRLNFKFEEGPPGGSEIVEEENKKPYFPLTKLLKSDLNLLKPIEDTFFKKLRKGKEKLENKEKVGMSDEHFPSTNLIVNQNIFFPKPSKGNGNENNAGHAQPGHAQEFNSVAHHQDNFFVTPFMCGSCHFGRASNDEFNVECRILNIYFDFFPANIKVRSERGPIYLKLSPIVP